MAEARPSPRTDALDVIVELIAELDERPRPGGSGLLRPPLRGALPRQASMERAGLMLYDERAPARGAGGQPRARAEPAGGRLRHLEETPIAQVALSEDRVVQVDRRLERWVPARYARFARLDDAHVHARCRPAGAGSA